MGTNNSQYQALKELRYALAALPAAKQKMNAAQEEQEKHQRQLSASKGVLAAPPHSKNRKYTGRLKASYEKTARQADAESTEKARNRAKQHDRAEATELRVLLAIVTLIVFGFTAYLVYIAAKWSWETSLPALMSTSGATHNEAVGLHLFALSVALFIGGAIMMTFAPVFGIDKESAGMSTRLGSGILMIGAGIVSLIASFVYYFSDVDGFWAVLGHIFLIIPAAFMSIIALWRVFAFVASLMLLFISVSCMLSLIFNTEAKKRNYSVIVVKSAMKALDYAPLYNSDVYKEAEKLDAEYDREMDEINIEKHRGIVEIETKYVNAYQRSVSEYQATIKKCNDIIRNATFLHPDQRNLKLVDIIIYYLDHHLANTITEALQEYKRDQQHTQLIGSIEGLRQDLRLGVTAITNKLNTMQNALSSEIASVRVATERQTAAIQQESERLREQNEKIAEETQKAANRRAERLNERLGDIIFNQRTSLGWH